MENQTPPECPRASLSMDHLILPRTPLGHTGILNIEDDFSRLGILIPVSDLTFSATAYHLLFNVMLRYGKPQIIRSDRGPAFTR